MMAESPEMGRLMGLVGSAMSMMTTWAASVDFSRIQMYLSDSIVRLLKEMLEGWMPTLVSWVGGGEVIERDVGVLDADIGKLGGGGGEREVIEGDVGRLDTDIGELVGGWERV